MNRKVRRSLAVVVGLALGWSAAGFLPGTLLEPHPSVAATEPAAEHAPGHDADAAAPAGHGREGAASGTGAHGHGEAGEGHDPGLTAAGELVPESRAEVPWLRPVLLAAGGLFV